MPGSALFEGSSGYLRHRLFFWLFISSNAQFYALAGGPGPGSGRVLVGMGMGGWQLAGNLLS